MRGRGVARGYPEVVIEDFFNVLGPGESEAPKSVVPDDALTKEPICGTEVSDAKAGSENGLEVKDEGTITADEDTVVDVDG